MKLIEQVTCLSKISCQVSAGHITITFFALCIHEVEQIFCLLVKCSQNVYIKAIMAAIIYNNVGKKGNIIGMLLLENCTS